MSPEAAQLPEAARRRPMLRPWAVAGPILILFICLPMLRPLRHWGEVSPEESSILAMVQQNLRGEIARGDGPALSLRSLTEPS
ncbi:MAG: hypothetical protein NZ561_05440, partial [Phycisphaerae bacterium]|nr:hypothetical protein [Phycisphaerae bacterium]